MSIRPTDDPRADEPVGGPLRVTIELARATQAEDQGTVRAQDYSGYWTVGGTSLSGGALPLADGILLGMAKFNRVLEIDYANRCAVVIAS